MANRFTQDGNDQSVTAILHYLTSMNDHRKVLALSGGLHPFLATMALLPVESKERLSPARY